MPAEDHPSQARWRAANEVLNKAAARLRAGPEHAAAQMEYYQAQAEYDAAVDALHDGISDLSG